MRLEWRAAETKGSSVLCVGTGGLGSPLLMYLAAAGVGRIGIVDFDVVDIESSTPDFAWNGIRRSAQSAICSDSHCRHQSPHPGGLFEEHLTSENALRIIEPYDVVVDGTDNFPTRYLVNDACVILGKPNVYGSIFKFEGQASVFQYREDRSIEICIQSRHRGLVPSCAEEVLGILPGVIGCIQATETIKILLGRGHPVGTAVAIYALGMQFRQLKLRKDRV